MSSLAIGDIPFEFWVDNKPARTSGVGLVTDGSPSGFSVGLDDVQICGAETSVSPVHEDVAQDGFGNALAGRISVITMFDFLDAVIDEGIDLVAQVLHPLLVKHWRC
jgi:hypothetical protein